MKSREAIYNIFDPIRTSIRYVLSVLSAAHRRLSVTCIAHMSHARVRCQCCTGYDAQFQHTCYSRSDPKAIDPPDYLARTEFRLSPTLPGKRRPIESPDHLTDLRTGLLLSDERGGHPLEGIRPRKGGPEVVLNQGMAVKNRLD